MLADGSYVSLKKEQIPWSTQDANDYVAKE